jgi:hypothetical protein
LGSTGFGRRRRARLDRKVDTAMHHVRIQRTQIENFTQRRRGRSARAVKIAVVRAPIGVKPERLTTRFAPYDAPCLFIASARHPAATFMAP